MKVKDLVRELAKTDPEADVIVWVDTLNGYNTAGAGLLREVDTIDNDLGRVYLVGTDGTS